MTTKRAFLIFGVITAVSAALTGGSRAQDQESAKLYNTAKQKLMEGKPIVGGTGMTRDTRR